MICTIWNHEDLTCGHLEQSFRHPELFSLFLPFKSEPCKIFKKHVEYRVLDSGGSKLMPKWTPKVIFFCVLKSCKNNVKYRVSGGSRPQKNKPQKYVSFFCEQRCFSITHGFALMKLIFRSVNEHIFLYFWLFFLLVLFLELNLFSVTDRKSSNTRVKYRVCGPSCLLSEHWNIWLLA